jgi:hypothetical protein
MLIVLEQLLHKIKANRPKRWVHVRRRKHEQPIKLQPKLQPTARSKIRIKHNTITFRVLTLYTTILFLIVKILACQHVDRRMH